MPLTPEQRSKRAQLAARTRWAPNKESTLDAQREFRAARAEDYVRRLVDEAPPLTRAQRDRLALLLRGRAPQARGESDAAA